MKHTLEVCRRSSHILHAWLLFTSPRFSCIYMKEKLNSVIQIIAIGTKNVWSPACEGTQISILLATRKSICHTSISPTS